MNFEDFSESQKRSTGLPAQTSFSWLRCVLFVVEGICMRFVEGAWASYMVFCFYVNTMYNLQSQRSCDTHTITLCFQNISAWTTGAFLLLFSAHELNHCATLRQTRFRTLCFWIKSFYTKHLSNVQFKRWKQMHIRHLEMQVSPSCRSTWRVELKNEDYL